MTVIPKYETIKADDYKTLPPKQTAVECLLKADEGSVISKVLAITYDVSLLSCESVSGEARYSGRVDCKALYKDDKGEMNTIAYYADFSDKLEDAAIVPLSQLSCTLNIADSETSSVNKNEIKLVCVIEAFIKVNNVIQVEVLSGGEGFLSNQSSANISNYSGGGKEICEVNEEFEEKCMIKKILLSDASVIVTSVGAGVDVITAEGEAAVKLTYLSDDGVIGGIMRVMPFKHEIDAKEVMPGDKAFAECTIKTLKINAVVDEEKKVTALSLTLDIEINGKAYGSTCINFIDDAFSPDCKLNMSYGKLNSRMFMGSFNYNEKIEGVAALDEGMAAPENILASSGSRVHIANIMPGEDFVTVEGIAVSTVLYSVKTEETIKIASVNVEIPFSLNLEMAGARSGDSVNISAAVFDVETRNRKGNEIEVKMQIKLRGDLFTEETVTVLSDIAVSEGEMAPQSSVTIYFPGENEKLWDVAKQLCVSPETIMEYNPEIKFPAGAGSRIFIYRQKS
jgi:hypothetical protein